MGNMKLGVQSCMIREAMDADLRGTLERLKASGFEGIELWSEQYKQDLPALRAAILEAGLEISSWHTELWPLVTDLDHVIACNRQMGNRDIVVSYLPPITVYSRKSAEAAAELFNRLGRRLSDAGMNLGFHNFGPEPFLPMEGLSIWDCLCQQCEPGIFMQLDTGTAAMADMDLPALIQRTGSRLRSLHMKPYTHGMPTKEAGCDPMIGEDDLPYDAILAACADVSPAWCLVEYESVARYTPIYAAELALKRLREKGFFSDSIGKGAQ